MTQNSSYGTLGLYTDFYELSMAQGYFLSGKKDEQTVFDYFYRTNPYSGGFLVFAGLGDLLCSLADFRYSEENINILNDKGFKLNSSIILKIFGSMER